VDLPTLGRPTIATFRAMELSGERVEASL